MAEQGTSGAIQLGLMLVVVHADTQSLSPALQKQIGCFNHRVVALVADKLETVVVSGLL